MVAVLEREFSWPLTYNGDRDAYQITLPRSPTFADVPTSFWGYKAIEKAVLDKITNGCAVSPQVLFCPNDTVTRAQLATFIVRASGLDLVKYGKPQNTFTDVAPTGATAWAYESVNAVVNAGIMTATNGTFNANGAVTEIWQRWSREQYHFRLNSLKKGTDLEKVFIKEAQVDVEIDTHLNLIHRDVIKSARLHVTECEKRTRYVYDAVRQV